MEHIEYIVIDRIVHDIAICERSDRTMINLSVSALPEGVREGNVLAFDGESYKIDREEEEKRRRKLQERMDRLWK